MGDSFILEAQSSNIICFQQISIIGDNFILESLICLSNVFDVEIVECLYSAIPWSFLLFCECLGLFLI